MTARPLCIRLNGPLTAEGQSRGMTLRASLALAATLLAALPAPLASAFGIGLQPSTVELTVEPGATQRQTITIGNVHTERTIALSLSLADWSLDADGQLVLDAPGETERSGSDWVHFSPAQVVLEPGTKTDVVVEISTPARVDHLGDHRFALLATTRLPDDRGGVSGVWSKYQLASLFYLTFTPASSTPEVVAVAPLENAPGTLRMTVKNTGDAHARLQGQAVVKSASGEVVHEVDVNGVVLDNAERHLDVSLAADNIPSGSYTVDFNIRNSFAPQNGFRPVSVPVDSVSYVAP